MTYNENDLELYINGERVDIYSADSIGIRLNNVLYDPAEIISEQADYSFSFDIPSTPRNNRIFRHCNELAVTDKFINTLPAKLYSDGQLLFDGSVTINSYSDGRYNLNLVVIKAVNYQDIFSDTKLSDLEWYIPFEGVETINSDNASSGDVTFPLISYGPFQKVPYLSDEVGNAYTSKYDLDEYNRWYLESFYPSPRLVTLVRKCFEQKGYNVLGEVFNDERLNHIYLSTNLDDKQDPTYNLGNRKLGSVSLSLTARTGTDNYEQELAFPYFNAKASFVPRDGVRQGDYNWKSVQLYDLLSNGTVTMNQSPCYMYQPNEHLIVIPADGFYKIEMDVHSMTQQMRSYNVDQWEIRYDMDAEEKTVTIEGDMREMTPVEIHLVKNYDDDIELIKGKWNTQYRNGNPTVATDGEFPNKVQWMTCFPHSDLYNSVNPTEKNNLSFRNTNTSSSRGNSSSTRQGSGSSGTTTGTTDGTRGLEGRTSRRTARSSRFYSESMKGYVYKDGDIMVYDQAVNPNFICGFSTLSSGVTSVIRNGHSWSATISESNESFYEQSGYLRLTSSSSTDTQSATTVNANTYLDAPISRFSSNVNSANGNLACMVYLRKNDILQLFAVQRAYHQGSTDVQYETDIKMSLSIEAASPSDYALLRSRNYGYGSSSEFDKNLRIGNFLNSGTTMADFIENAVRAFNLSVSVDGKNVFIDKKVKFAGNASSVVDIDCKANSSDARVRGIGYPSSMSVRYNIDTEEYGFEQTVPMEYINLREWADYGDSGFTVISLSDMDGRNEMSEDLEYSYTYYSAFNWKEVSSDDERGGGEETIWLPTISKSEYMIDGYDYSESLKYDGYGLPQRLWFQPQRTEAFVWTDAYPSERVEIYVPSNSYLGLNLSYKTTERSILTEFFNINAYTSSNYAEIDVFLTAEEYKLIKGGARVRFDSDIYYVTEIEGFDPSGNDKTTLHMIKNVK